ncbi:uncharacterized protein [Mytilus edulis]
MSSTRGDKRVKGGGTFTLCSSVIAKCGNEIKNLCKNHLYEYEDQETWNDVLHDVLEGENFPFHKTDTITTCVSDKLTGTATFKPDMEEPIRIVKEFDRTLKYVTFTINRDKDVGLTNPDSRKTTSTTQSAFTVMINSCNSKKDPKHKDIKAANFTGDVLHGKVFVRLQLSCSSHIEFAFYASNIGRVDLCAHCASPETNKDQELLKKIKVVLPVCGECIQRKKDIPKRNPKK